MGHEPHFDPEFAELLERTRKELAEAGIYPRRGPVPPVESIWPPDVTEALMAWVREGGYAEAVARVVAEDPDLANQ